KLISIYVGEGTCWAHARAACHALFLPTCYAIRHCLNMRATMQRISCKTTRCCKAHAAMRLPFCCNCLALTCSSRNSQLLEPLCPSDGQCCSLDLLHGGSHGCVAVHGRAR